MIEVIKELSEIVKDLPDLAVWILCGLLFYKVFIIGSGFALARFFIVKVHDYLKAEKKIVVEEKVSVISLDGKVITEEFDSFMKLVDFMRAEHKGYAGSGTWKSEYVHGRDIEFAMEAIREKREREKK